MSDAHIAFRSAASQVAGLGLFAASAPASREPAWLTSPKSVIEHDFKAYHAEHPDVYTNLELGALRWFEANPNGRIGIAKLVENLRYSKAVVVDDELFKLNNNHRALYARLLIHYHPKLSAAIETRGRREDGASSDRDTTGRQR